jgi:chromosome segregation ATPase
MLVNIEDMSAEQLFELANKKKRAEEEAAKRAAALERLGEVRKDREKLLREFEQALAASDKEMQALQKRREQLITQHQAALAVIDKKLAELEQEQDAPAGEAPAVPAKASAPAEVEVEPGAEPEKAAPARRSSDKGGRQDELTDVIMDIMHGRQTISESLLKEQLRTRGHSVTELGKTLEQMVRDGKLTSRGYGNYAPGKKR